ncbi:MAG: hypothetical protein ACWGOX_05355 [Desulforhopalus sp.]
MNSSTDQLIENEWYIVRHSGEIPEIAYNSAIYFLTRAKEGPRLRLSEQHRQTLKNAAALRFSEIVLRDLDHSNWGKPIYRGVERSRVNYERFSAFCRRQQIDGAAIRQMAADALIGFLKTELLLIKKNRRRSIINCTYPNLQVYAADLGVELEDSFAELRIHCP